MTPENERDTAAADGGTHTDTRTDDAGQTGSRSGGDKVEAPREDGNENASASPSGSGATNGAGTAPPGAGDPASEATANTAIGDGTDEGAGEGVALEDRLAAAEAQAAAHWDRLVRLQAEMENQRKRAQRDVSNSRKFALEAIAQDLLPVKDSLELGLAAANAEEADLASLRQGSELTLKMLAQVLEKHAIVEIDPQGEKFDPEFHQAMSMQEVEGVPPNTVTGVMQKGYILNERLIRPALVMVSK